MKQIRKILAIILLFFAVLICIALVWYGLSATRSQANDPIPFIDYVLYLLGFCELDMRDHYLQTGFSTLGLLTITLLSSVFTVNLFEMRSKVTISKSMVITGTHRGELELRSVGRDIYNLTATLISKCGSEVSTQQQYLPFVAKKERVRLPFEIAPGTPLYKYLRETCKENGAPSQLILTVVYTDIENGQEYTMAQKYQYGGEKSDFTFCPKNASITAAALEDALQNTILSNTFPLNLALAKPINAEDITLSWGDSDGASSWNHKQALCGRVHMDSRQTYLPRDFTMAVWQDPQQRDWTKYYDLGCALKFSYRVEKNIRLTMELKCGQHNHCVITETFAPAEDFGQYTLPLNKLDRQMLEQVSELCFTVFYQDVDADDPTGAFTIRDCVLEVESRR